MTRLSELVREKAAEVIIPFTPASAGSVQASTGVTAVPPAALYKGAEQGDWYDRAYRELVAIKQAIHARHTWELGELTAIAAGITHALNVNDRLIGTVMDARQDELREHVIENAVNVAVLSTKIAMGLNYAQPQLEQVALAGLLHDIGMLGLSDGLINKTEDLSEDELKLLRQHPQRGIALLALVNGVAPWLRTVVMQEHERWNGTGYPRGLKGEEIDEVALIVGLADVLEALIRPRPYRSAVLPHEALKALLTNGKAVFPNRLLKALVDQLSMYPLGTTVRLNTGETGVVAELNKRQPFRPILFVQQHTASGERARSTTLDLSASTSIHIVEAVQSLVAR